MKDNLDRIIKNVENKWLYSLTNVCTLQFNTCHLPSHDHTHHLRVWKLAKLLLYHLPNNTELHEEDVEQLIIAVFFHDQGMSITTSKEHGKISRHLCKEYIDKTNLPQTHIEKILDSVEKHDDKNYIIKPLPEKYDLLALLNIADDLDAFGVIGIYRYLEIYLLRKTPVREMPEKIADNLRSRFQHFTGYFAHNKQFIRLQTQRYIATRGFFNDLELQLKQWDYSPEIKLGPMGVINFINEELINKKAPLDFAITKALSHDADFYFTTFFDKLSKSLQE